VLLQVEQYVRDKLVYAGFGDDYNVILLDCGCLIDTAQYVSLVVEPDWSLSPANKYHKMQNYVTIVCKTALLRCAGPCH